MTDSCDRQLLMVPLCLLFPSFLVCQPCAERMLYYLGSYPLMDKKIWYPSHRLED